MNQQDAEEYTQALGQVVAGGWRQVALGERLGVPKALGLSVEDWVEGRLGGYVRLSIPERRGAVAELEEEGFSGRETADVLGVDESTVRSDKKASAGNPAPEPEDASNDGPLDDTSAGNPAPEPDPEPPPVADLEKTSSRLRRSKALMMLAQAHKAVAVLGSSVDSIAEAILTQGPDAIRAEREGLERMAAIQRRLAEALDEGASKQLRRVK